MQVGDRVVFKNAKKNKVPDMVYIINKVETPKSINVYCECGNNCNFFSIESVELDAKLHIPNYLDRVNECLLIKL